MHLSGSHLITSVRIHACQTEWRVVRGDTQSQYADQQLTDPLTGCP